jgi:hypothetical protein
MRTAVDDIVYSIAFCWPVATPGRLGSLSCPSTHPIPHKKIICKKSSVSAAHYSRITLALYSSGGGPIGYRSLEALPTSNLSNRKPYGPSTYQEIIEQRVRFGEACAVQTKRLGKLGRTASDCTDQSDQIDPLRPGWPPNPFENQ